MKIVNSFEKSLSRKLGSKTKIIIIGNLCNLNKKIVILCSKLNLPHIIYIHWTGHIAI